MNSVNNTHTHTLTHLDDNMCARHRFGGVTRVAAARSRAIQFAHARDPSVHTHTHTLTRLCLCVPSWPCPINALHLATRARVWHRMCVREMLSLAGDMSQSYEGAYLTSVHWLFRSYLGPCPHWDSEYFFFVFMLFKYFVLSICNETFNEMYINNSNIGLWT